MADETYMYTTAPQAFFGFGNTRVTVWKGEDGKMYPHASGRVSKKLDEACAALRGKKMTVFDIQKQLWNLLNEKEG